MWRLARITGWGFREIVEELPFAAGLQIIQADDFAQGNERAWQYNDAPPDVDLLTRMDEALKR